MRNGEELPSSSKRTGLGSAILLVIDALQKFGGLNVSQVSEVTGLNWKTADRVLSLLVEVSEKMIGKKITEYNAGQARMYILADEIGLDRIPTRLRDMIIREEFPEATEQQNLLVDLLLKGASCSAMAAEIGDSTIELDLVRTGRAILTDTGRIFLTDLGMRIARGSLRTYPELAQE